MKVGYLQRSDETLRLCLNGALHSLAAQCQGQSKWPTETEEHFNFSSSRGLSELLFLHLMFNEKPVFFHSTSNNVHWLDSIDLGLSLLPAGEAFFIMDFSSR